MEIRVKLKFLVDRQRHLICTPYCVENLHAMAESLGIKRHWFHAKPYPHYDVPKKMQESIYLSCYITTSKMIVKIARGDYTAEQLVMLGHQHGIEDDESCTS